MNIIRIATIWTLGLFSVLLATLVVATPMQLLLPDTPLVSLSMELAGVLVWLSAAHFSVRRSAKSPNPLAWKSLAAFLAASAVLMTWTAFGDALLYPLRAPQEVTASLVALLLAAVVAGWFCFSLAMKLFRDIASQLRAGSTPESLLAAATSPVPARQD